MSLLRQSPFCHFPAFTQPLRQTRRATFTTTSRYLAFSDYGSGDGDPRGEDPQAQGVSASADIEHPGPPPPAAGKGSGAGPTKGGEKQSHAGISPNTEIGKSQGSLEGSGSTRETHPAILKETSPKEGEESKEVRDHNQEVILRKVPFLRNGDSEKLFKRILTLLCHSLIGDLMKSMRRIVILRPSRASF